MKRREFGKLVAGSALTSAMLTPTQSKAEDSALPRGKQIEIGMLLYPEVSFLDLLGPQTVLSSYANIYLAWKSRDLIRTDTGIGVLPNATLEECPRKLDVLFVPGGFGMIPVMKDAEVIAFLADRGARADYVTSVCSGSIILAAAGLLRGYKATSHWAVTQLLPLFGAEPVEGRVVTDRNRITGGGVTAGIDFGLALLAKLRGEEDAKTMQLVLEYDPQPPFHAGSPQAAGPAITERVMAFVEPIHRETRAIARAQATQGIR